MQATATRAHIIALCLALALICAPATGRGAWFRKQLTWQAGKEPSVLETTITSLNGNQQYRFAFVPLWAVEGGIIGVEILLAKPDHPDDNLLGQRETDVPAPFVITVEELERGIKRSQFGPKRKFRVEKNKLTVEILGSRLGNGVGDCLDCKNIQEITAAISFEKK